MDIRVPPYEQRLRQIESNSIESRYLYFRVVTPPCEHPIVKTIFTLRHLYSNVVPVSVIPTRADTACNVTLTNRTVGCQIPLVEYLRVYDTKVKFMECSMAVDMVLSECLIYSFPRWDMSRNGRCMSGSRPDYYISLYTCIDYLISIMYR